MVVTRTELSQIVDQVNNKFEELESKIKELEAELAAKRKTTKQTQKAA
jgi:uncharacterized coiled-coil DUF342 family protein|tara:strand:- start:749 stop:892 length:144 start_codon:yes stop_codon:yes gene_type:complete